MNDAFWIALPAIIAAAFAGINTIIAAIGNRRINANTAVTVVGQQELGDKMDSATRSVKQDALLAAKVAKTESNKVLDSINDMRNGGPGGIGELTQRVARLEAGHKEVVQGQADLKAGHAEVVRGQVGIVKSIDDLATAINRKQLS